MRITLGPARLVLLALCMTGSVAGCGSDEPTTSASANPTDSPEAIACDFSFRRSLETSQFQSERLTVRSHQDERESRLGPFRVRLLLFDDGFEARSLNVYVYSVERRKLLTQDLYQFGETLENQFVGDQGFSGLRYVRNPDSRAELQYICETA
jgi:hypothetical protein